LSEIIDTPMREANERTLRKKIEALIADAPVEELWKSLRGCSVPR
jgi:hypothetical protein